MKYIVKILSGNRYMAHSCTFFHGDKKKNKLANQQRISSNKFIAFNYFDRNGFYLHQQ